MAIGAFRDFQLETSKREQADKPIVGRIRADRSPRQQTNAPPRRGRSFFRRDEHRTKRNGQTIEHVPRRRSETCDRRQPRRQVRQGIDDAHQSPKTIHGGKSTLTPTRRSTASASGIEPTATWGNGSKDGRFPFSTRIERSSGRRFQPTVPATSREIRRRWLEAARGRGHSDRKRTCSAVAAEILSWKAKAGSKPSPLTLYRCIRSPKEAALVRVSAKLVRKLDAEDVGEPHGFADVRSNDHSLRTSLPVRSPPRWNRPIAPRHRETRSERLLPRTCRGEAASGGDRETRSQPAQASDGSRHAGTSKRQATRHEAAGERQLPSARRNGDGRGSGRVSSMAATSCRKTARVSPPG